VTMNDPVYIEAAQALARSMAQAAGTPNDKARDGFRRCLARPPHDDELRQIVSLYGTARAEYANKSEDAKKISGKTSDANAEKINVVELAAWTTVGNVLLNLDETLMKP